MEGRRKTSLRIQDGLEREHNIEEKTSRWPDEKERRSHRRDLQINLQVSTYNTIDWKPPGKKEAEKTTRPSRPARPKKGRPKGKKGGEQSKQSSDRAKIKRLDMGVEGSSP